MRRISLITAETACLRMSHSWTVHSKSTLNARAIRSCHTIPTPGHAAEKSKREEGKGVERIVSGLLPSIDSGQQAFKLGEDAGVIRSIHLC